MAAALWPSLLLRQAVQSVATAASSPGFRPPAVRRSSRPSFCPGKLVPRVGASPRARDALQATALQQMRPGRPWDRDPETQRVAKCGTESRFGGNLLEGGHVVGKGPWCGWRGHGVGYSYRPCAEVVGLAGHVRRVLRSLEKGPSRRSCVQGGGTPCRKV